ncbi:hypothetical protein C0995_012272 [Termitomyces sp. Mi166|nr:hypothetical protein C0995_012272 [Termitomyces sp. Mi166\
MACIQTSAVIALLQRYRSILPNTEVTDTPWSIDIFPSSIAQQPDHKPQASPHPSTVLQASALEFRHNVNLSQSPPSKCEYLQDSKKAQALPTSLQIDTTPVKIHNEAAHDRPGPAPPFVIPPFLVVLAWVVKVGPYPVHFTKPTSTTTPIGAIVGGVVGGLVGIGILTILFIIWLRRRRPSPLQRLPAPVPLSYDPNYVQPLDKTSQLLSPACQNHVTHHIFKGQLAQIINEKEAAERQRDQLQTEVESTRDRSSGISDTPSGNGPSERLIEALRQRILELETQQRDLEHQLLPPSYLDSTSVP